MNPDSRMPHTDAMVVLTTVANEKEGIALVRGLLERRGSLPGWVQVALLWNMRSGLLSPGGPSGG